MRIILRVLPHISKMPSFQRTFRRYSSSVFVRV
jgi:hypothetical protein